LAFLLCVGQYGIAKTTLSLTNKMAQFFLQVIRMAAHWIHQWSSILPADQRELMDIGAADGCSGLLFPGYGMPAH
jgi:hypothetical protein